MRATVVLALGILAGTLSAPALGADETAPPQLSAGAAQTTLLPWLLCIPGLAESPVCAVNLQAYLSHSKVLTLGSEGLFGPANRTTRARLSRRFDAAFRSRRRRQTRCLQATPSQPPKPYRHEQRAAWAQDLSVTSKQPFFYVLQRQTSVVKQPSYALYFYCATHGGF